MSTSLLLRVSRRGLQGLRISTLMCYFSSLPSLSRWVRTMNNPLRILRKLKENLAMISSLQWSLVLSQKLRAWRNNSSWILLNQEDISVLPIFSGQLPWNSTNTLKSCWTRMIASLPWRGLAWTDQNCKWLLTRSQDKSDLVVWYDLLTHSYVAFYNAFVDMLVDYLLYEIVWLALNLNNNVGDKAKIDCYQRSLREGGKLDRRKV